VVLRLWQGVSAYRHLHAARSFPMIDVNVSCEELQAVVVVGTFVDHITLPFLP
jgi:hypothetical protein